MKKLLKKKTIIILPKKANDEVNTKIFAKEKKLKPKNTKTKKN